MSTDALEPGLPLLLIQAAQSAAQADGLPPPPTGESSDGSKPGDGSNGVNGVNFDQRPGLGSSGVPKADNNNGMLSAASGVTGLRGASGPSSLSPSPGVVGAAGKKKGPPLRRGKWTPEEEAYANRLIQEFKAGLLPLTDGTTLRTFLSKLLNCDPMRISKKFVGSNCIGKQVFRRRTADINRLTPEQIQQSRAELSELERRFLERVAQTNRVKSSGVGSNGTSSATSGNALGKPKEEAAESTPPSPPWLQPPNGYKQGAGAAMAAANLSGRGGSGNGNGMGLGLGLGMGSGSNGSGSGSGTGSGGSGVDSSNRAAAAGRALLQGLNAGSLKSSLERNSDKSALASHGSAGLLAMAELQRHASQQSLLQNTLGNSASNLLAAAAAARSGSSSGLSGSAMAQLARSASAARMAGLASGSSMNNLMLKTGLSRDQLSQLARDRGLSSASLSNMIERQNSFDALMSLDFQSLQSIDNLANLIQTGGGGLPGQGSGLDGEMKNSNWSADAGLSASRSNLAAAAAASGSSGNLSHAARRLASAGRMESLLRSLSGNLGNGGSGGEGSGGSNANINNLLQSMQSNLGNLGNSGNNGSGLFGPGNPSASAVSLANLLRPDSSTGLTALRMQEGLNQRNSSVEDFLSLVAAGDIPHQDPSMLNIPLMQQQPNSQNDPQSAAAILAQRQLLAQARNQSFGNLGGFSGNMNQSSSAAALALAQARADQCQSSHSNKRKLLDLEGGFQEQGSSKR